MPRTYEYFLQDILKAANSIHQYIEGYELESFKVDQMRVDAVMHNLMIVGEAIKNIPADIRQKMPEIQWQRISRFRDLVVHHYFGIDLENVWQIIQTHLPELQSQVTELLQQLQEEKFDDSASDS